MTEIIKAKLAGVMSITSSGGALYFGTVDATTQTAIVTTISLFISTLGVIATAWIAYKMRQLEHNTNGIKDALIASTKQVGRAEGKAEGKAEQKAEGEKALVNSLDKTTTNPP